MDDVLVARPELQGDDSIQARNVRDRGHTLGWWHHFMIGGALPLLYDVEWLNIAGGFAFGVGLAWWLCGRAYGHDLGAWWKG